MVWQEHIHRIDSGSIVLLQPISQAGADAIDNVLRNNGEAMTFGGALVTEPRYTGALLEQLEEEGWL